MDVLALSSSLLFLFPSPQKLIYWHEKWRIWLGQKKPKVSLTWQATKHMARTWTLGKIARIQTLALTITTSCAILGKLLTLSVFSLLVCVIRRIRSMVWRLNESTFVKGLVPGTQQVSYKHLWTQTQSGLPILEPWHQMGLYLPGRTPAKRYQHCRGIGWRHFLTDSFKARRAASSTIPQCYINLYRTRL